MCLEELGSFSGAEVVIGGSRPGISGCIPVTSFGFLYRLESLKYHQKTYFCDFPIALIPVTMSCSQATAKLSGQNPTSMGTLKCTQHNFPHEGNIKNGKQDVRDQKMLEKVLPWGQLILAKEYLGRLHTFQSHDQHKEDPSTWHSHAGHHGPPASAIIRSEPRLVYSGL